MLGSKHYAFEAYENEETHHQLSFKIDLNPPDPSVDEFRSGVYLFGRKIWSAEKTIFIESFSITGVVADEESVVDTVQFFLDESLFAETTQSSFSVTCA